MIDLNVFVPPGSGLRLIETMFINDAGKIVVAGLLPNGDQHAFVLIPCDEEDTDAEGCIDNHGDSETVIERSTATTSQTHVVAIQPILTPNDFKNRIRALMASRRLKTFRQK